MSDIQTPTQSQSSQSWSSFFDYFRLPTSNVGIFVAVSTGLTLVGATSYFIVTRYYRKKSQSNEEQWNEFDDEEYLYRDFDKRRQRYHANDIPQPLMTFEELHDRAYLMSQQRLEQRRSKIYFDSNDEYVLEDAIPELLEMTVINQAEDDADSYEQKVMERINHKYHNIVVFFGDDEVLAQGTTRITKNIFQGTQDRVENAYIFLENLNKVQSSKQKQSLSKLAFNDRDDLNASFETEQQTDAEISTLNNRRQRFNSQSGFDEVESLDPIAEDENSQNDDVLLNIAPKKFEKPKDQLFLDFFSMYTKKFIDEEQKREQPPANKQHKNTDRSLPRNRGLQKNKQMKLIAP